MSTPEFQEFPKIARLSRHCIISEKIDGSNGQVLITESGDVFAGSRNRWLTPQSDNFGFAAWVEANRALLLMLGPGRHFGEWWGCGIQRGYGLKEKRFSLFNASRWCNYDEEPDKIHTEDPRIVKMQEKLPEGLSTVPVIHEGQFTTEACQSAIELLRNKGSYAAPGFMNPEGIVVYHVAAGIGFKKTLEKDGQPKSK